MLVAPGSVFQKPRGEPGRSEDAKRKGYHLQTAMGLHADRALYCLILVNAYYSIMSACYRRVIDTFSRPALGTESCTVGWTLVSRIPNKILTKSRLFITMCVPFYTLFRLTAYRSFLSRRKKLISKFPKLFVAGRYPRNWVVAALSKYCFTNARAYWRQRERARAGIVKPSRAKRTLLKTMGGQTDKSPGASFQVTHSNVP